LNIIERLENLESVRLDVDENVSREKFLQLNDVEVQSPDTTEEDLWNGLNCIGFNHALELDMVGLFFVNSLLYLENLFFRCVNSN
jgi:hypothetical protein